MKKILYILVAASLLLASCDKDDQTLGGGNGGGAKGTLLAINVAVDGFGDAGANSSPTRSALYRADTRAVDDAYATAFEENDAIGIFATGGTTDYTNVKWVRKADGSWAPATDTDAIYYGTGGMTLTAYFPYDAATVTLPIAATFTVQADQSTPGNYRASDLLLSTSVPWNGGATGITFNFAHAMAMVEIVPSASGGQVTLRAATKSGQTPERLTCADFGKGIFRALIPAQTLTTTIEISYTQDVYDYPITKTVASANYYRYDIATLPYKVGDYYPDPNAVYNSSGILQKGREATGVVFRAKTAIQKGLVVSLNEKLGLKWSWDASNNSPLFETTKANDNNDGMANMSIIKAIGGWESNYPAFKWCSDKGADWYLPAPDELEALYAAWNGGSGTTEVSGMRATFNSKLTIAGGTIITTSYYWSSSERDDNDARIVDFFSGYQSFGTKSNDDRVRCVLAF